MPQATWPVVLRSIAVLIAVAAVIDPVMTVTRPVVRPIVVAQLTATDTSAVDAAIRNAVAGAEPIYRQAVDGRLPCGAGEPCLVVADGSVDVSIPGDLDAPIALVNAATTGTPNVAIRSVIASPSHHAAGSGTVRVVLSGAGMQGRRSEVRVTDGGATIGSGDHAWTADGEVSLDIPWWPMGDGARTLRVSAVPTEGEVTAIDNAVDVGVHVAAARIPVLVFDARPSWASTFVRRALEDDARFLVEHRVGLGPSLAAGTPASRLDARSLDAAAVVIAGAPESLAAADVALLERFVRTRGGVLVLLPDRAPSGVAARLFPGRWTEHLEATVSPVGPLRVSESLRMPAPTLFDQVLASLKGSATIVASPSGNGRVVVSGALDAWRYRADDGGAFDRFWRTLVIESAATSAAVGIEFAQGVVPAAAEVPMVVRRRTMDEGESTAVSATATCGDQPAVMIRLWPAGPPGVFTGTVGVGGAGPCEVMVAVENGPVAVAGIAVTNGATRTVNEVLAKLERAATTRGGVTVSANQAAAAVASLAPPPRDESQPIRPMQSPWWMFPFVTCLSAEWWLRRRNGLR